MPNVLVTGSSGQLGSEIKELVQGDLDLGFGTDFYFYFTDSKTLDITNHEKARKYIEKNSIKVIINCAAYTAVDKAESDEVNADAINHLAVNNLAKIAKEFGIKLIHISTDYVFDGNNFKPYAEDNITNPQGVYGRTKLEGEKAMLEINPKNSIIMRTSWVYSSYGANFVKTMLRLAKEKSELSVVFDQVGSPTYARDLARVVLDILSKIENDGVEIYHYSNEGVCSWYDFAKEIMRMAKLTCMINPIETTEYPTPAKRPHYSLLNKAKIKKDFGIAVPYWKDSLDTCLQKLGERS